MKKLIALILLLAVMILAGCGNTVAVQNAQPTAAGTAEEKLQAQPSPQLPPETQQQVLEANRSL